MFYIFILCSFDPKDIELIDWQTKQNIKYLFISKFYSFKKHSQQDFLVINIIHWK
jgi:hypothetical protein